MKNRNNMTHDEKQLEDSNTIKAIKMALDYGAAWDEIYYDLVYDGGNQWASYIMSRIDELDDGSN